MDEAKLKKILAEFEVPAPDENAKKRALAFAVAEFKAAETKRKNEFQGMSFISRLISRTTKNWRSPMAQLSNRRLMYGGMATAMAVVLIAGVTFTQLQSEMASRSDAAMTSTLNAVSFSADGGGPLSEIYGQQEAEITAPPGTAEASPAYIEAIQEENEARVDQAQRSGNSALPTPVQPPVGQLAMKEKKDNNFSRLLKNLSPGKTVGTGAATRQDYAAGSPPMAAEADSMGYGARSMIAPAPPGVIVPLPEPVDNYYRDEGRDKFKDFQPSPVKLVQDEPVSTFSIDVDTASYSVVRRQLNMGGLPAPDAIRIEELVNYFDYNYPLPESREQPFKPTVTVVDSPWTQGKKLVHIGIKGFDIPSDVKPHSNLVFLVDVSGSMDSPDKLPLVKASLKMMLDALQPSDTVALTVYAGSAGTVLEPTKVSDKAKILSAIDNLSAGGSTAGAAGIEEAYRLAEQHFDKEGVNRVILASDGDFNVGMSSDEDLKTLIEKKRESGIFLSVLGFGMGNLNDSLMQTLAQNGNGTAAYIDNINEARKVLVEEASSTLFPIAKDVKIQVEWNPAQVAEYRLVGYETRALNREDFNNDKVDAGDIGAGHAVTAIYEITPVGSSARTIDPSRYATNAQGDILKTEDKSEFANEIGFLKMRYKLPNENTSKLITTPITTDTKTLECPPCPAPAQCKPCNGASADTAFAIAVASFAQLLKGDAHVGDFTYDDVIALANQSKGADEFGIRAEFINLVRTAKATAGK